VSSPLRPFPDNIAASPSTDSATHKPVRLHYLDWLRVIAILGVFLFHALHPFDLADWHIKNAETSTAVTFIYAFLAPWGMPFFFLIAGTGSWYALRRRTPREYAWERFKRLCIPFICGVILLAPLMLYLEWRHKTQTGMLEIPFSESLANRIPGFTPEWFGALGNHLWFLGFLFCFALLTLPLFSWLRGESGRRMISALARLLGRRGGFLLLVLPLLLVQFGLRPFFSDEHDWADFFYLMCFFVLGYVFCADERFTRAIRRDWWVALIGGVATFVAITVWVLSTEDLNVPAAPRTLSDHAFWLLVTLNGVCWTVFFFFVGMRFLNFSNKWLQYGQEAVLPFFVLHQPVIMIIAFFVVQWDAGIPVKLPVVVLGSFAATMGLYEVIIRRIAPLRALFGMAPRRQNEARVSAG
jgi:glucan biosynthesis protein C